MNLKVFNEKKSFLLVSVSDYSSLIENMGIQLLYYIINKISGVSVERSFIPVEKIINELKSKNQILKSLESQIEVNKFNMIGISISNPLQLPNFFKWMELAKIPILSSDRTENDPLIIMGGIGISNPEPFSKFVDIFFLGDSQKAIKKFVELSKNLNKKELLKKSKNIKGLYLPLYKNKTIPIIEKNFIRLHDSRFVKKVATVMIDRGCDYGCDFCQYSYNTGKYYRFNSYKKISTSINYLIKNGVKKISICSATSCSHPDIIKILKFIQKKNAKSEIYPINATHLNSDFMLEQIKKNMGELILNLDSPSNRLRKIIKRRSMVDDDFFNIIKKAYHTFKIKNFSLFYIINLPNEKENDRLKISKFVNSILNLGDDIKIDLFINPLFPSPNTPLERYKMELPNITLSRLQRIWDHILLKNEKECIKKKLYASWSHSTFLNKKGVTIKIISIIDQFIEGLTLRGDDFSGMMVYDLYKNNFFNLDKNSFDTLKKIKKFLNKNYPFWKKYFKEISLSEKLPFDHVKPIVMEKIIINRYKKIKKLLNF
ncbi:MAG: radical SAM protein [Candidatus Nanoarchaeia archaeon]|nr:radical SAM protein [Candidatus Nanoarchaeia archaeon]MDD5054437.1 radical SAM protein [Candidatus Nanoarchaeia archaeon]MDD5499359.1 radical SAM protein [Candidatus Nanoarchaeia archaeon]